MGKELETSKEFKVETEFFTEYVQRLDKTLIFEQKIYNGVPVSLKIIDWYYGKSTEIFERLVKEYLQGDSRLKAPYEFYDFT